MCGLNQLPATNSEMISTIETPDIRKRKHMRPGGLTPIVSLSSTGEKEVNPMTWGIFCSDIQNNGGAGIYKIFIMNSFKFYKEVPERRCLVPMKDLFEKPQIRDVRTIMQFGVCESNSKIFFAAGTYEDMEDINTKKNYRCFSILTDTCAKEINNNSRNPLILDSNACEFWLRGPEYLVKEILSPTSAKSLI